MRTAFRVSLVGAILFLTACSNSDVPQQGNSINIGHRNVNMAHSAAQTCSLAGGKLRMAPQLDGSSVGVCSMSNGRQCDEFALMQGSCIR